MGTYAAEKNLHPLAQDVKPMNVEKSIIMGNGVDVDAKVTPSKPYTQSELAHASFWHGEALTHNNGQRFLPVAPTKNTYENYGLTSRELRK